MFKKSISEEFLRSQDKRFLSPVSSGKSSDVAAAIMYKSLDDMQISLELKQRLAKIVEDAKKFFPSFEFNQIPYYWLIKASRAKYNAMTIEDEDGNTASILIIRQIWNKDREVIGYDYIDLESGSLHMSRSGEAVDAISDGLLKAKSKRMAELTSIDRNTNLLLRDKQSYERNEMLAGFKKGDITNLIPAMSMLAKCYKILEERINRSQAIVKYYAEEFDRGQKGNVPPVFKGVQDVIDEELKSQSSKFIKSEVDIINALVMRYMGKFEEFEQKLNSGELNKLLSESKSGQNSQRHNVAQILNVVKEILMALKQESLMQAEKRRISTENRRNKSDEQQGPPDISTNPMFSVFPSLRIDSFRRDIPGDFQGVQSESAMIKQDYAQKIRQEEGKLNSLKNMQNGVHTILKVLNLKRESSGLSVMNFTESDMAVLDAALDECMSLYKSYSISIFVTDEKTKERRLDKRILGSIFRDDALDFFVARYIAVIITYIKMVFNKYHEKIK